MKKLCSLFLLMTSTVSLVADIIQPSLDLPTTNLPVSEEHKILFKEHYLTIEGIEGFPYLLAETIIQQSEFKIDSQELAKRFQEYVSTPEGENQYLQVYASIFNSDDSKQAVELIQSDLYKKCRGSLDKAINECVAKTYNILVALAQKKESTAAMTSIVKPAANQEVITMNKDNFQALMDSKKPLIIDVYADWCGPCRHLAPIFKEVNQEYGDLYTFAKLNVDEEEAIARSFEISALPTILFIKEGKIVGKQVGFIGKEKLLSKIKKYFE